MVPEDSVRAAVVAVEDALVSGEDDRVAALTTPDVILIDLGEDARWTAQDGGRLPRPLASVDPGVAWERVDETYRPLADGVALYSAMFAAQVDADEPYLLPAAESWIVVRTDAGWRVRYLHRSRGNDTPPL
jgi:hypothetical protein